jgi:hypothetical protein
MRLIEFEESMHKEKVHTILFCKLLREETAWENLGID